jgi:DNA-binding GntR family transcriptional regulator
MTNRDITEELRNAIANETYPAAQRLVETQLCRRYGVGRSRIREALRRLEQEGFVKITPFAGAVVAEFTQKDIEQIYDLMGVLEGLSMRVATPMLGSAEIAHIAELIEKMENAQNPALFFKSNLEFHQYLAELGGNQHLIKFMRILRPLALRMGLKSTYNPMQLRSSLREHRKILSAIQELNAPKVEKLIREHYLNAKQRLIKFINRAI